ncbi:unnamed protein product [Nezara viridula]|uniref:Uncharacterized protein n=1 Tax=Nezara viridula TaxID=85310 RepID=A0A9P0HTY5_NEZVI|nr:unnamed protein product [Nezara viridula]
MDALHHPLDHNTASPQSYLFTDWEIEKNHVCPGPLLYDKGFLRDTLWYRKAPEERLEMVHKEGALCNKQRGRGLYCIPIKEATSSFDLRKLYLNKPMDKYNIGPRAPYWYHLQLLFPVCITFSKGDILQVYSFLPTVDRKSPNYLRKQEGNPRRAPQLLRSLELQDKEAIDWTNRGLRRSRCAPKQKLLT